MPFFDSPQPMGRWLAHLSLFIAVFVSLSIRPETSSAGILDSQPEPAIQRMRFRSGATVLLASQPALPSFTVTVCYRVGRAHETMGLFGASELLSRLMLDGTKDYGTRNSRLEAKLLAELDRLDAAYRRKTQAISFMPPDRAAPVKEEIVAIFDKQQEYLRDLGANSTFGLYKELFRERGAIGPTVEVTQTEVQYTVTLPSDQLPFFMALEGQRLAGFSTRNFFTARANLANQRRIQQSQPGFELLRGVIAQAFQVHPFGRYYPDAASIEAIGRDELEVYQAQHFTPAQVIYTFVGGVRGAEVRRLADIYLSSLPPGPSPSLIQPVEPPQQGPRRFEIAADAPSQVLMAFHRDAAGLRPVDPMFPILLELLGDPTDGMLNRLIDHGLASEIVASEYPDGQPIGTMYPSLVMVGATSGPRGTADQLEVAIRKILAELATAGPTPEALEGARMRVRQKIARAFATPSLLAPLLSRVYATNEDETSLMRVFKAVEEIRLDQVKVAARLLFSPLNATTGVLNGRVLASPAEAAPEGKHASGHTGADQGGGLEKSQGHAPATSVHEGGGH